MVRLILSQLAQGDTAAIARDLADRASYDVAAKYLGLFEKLYLQLLDHPASGAPRPALGKSIRLGIVSPYVILYRYDERTDVVTILRILHGRRNITRRLIRDS